MAWLIWAGVILGAVGVGWAIYRFSGPAEEMKFCGACKELRPWHPKKGCSVCRTVEAVF